MSTEGAGAHAPPPGPTAKIVRVAIAVVTVALVFASSFNAALGQRDIAILLALAAPLGVASWGFARNGLHEAAVVLLSTVLVVVITMILALSPLGVHDPAVIAYSGVLLFNALLLSRRAFLMMVGLTVLSATLVFSAELLGLTKSMLGDLMGWPALVDFLLLNAVIGGLGRVVAEVLLASLGEAQYTAVNDRVTDLTNRARFLVEAATRLRTLPEGALGVLVLADLTSFRRINHVVGHLAADRILAECAVRARAVAPGSLIGRVGDDEFGLLVLGIGDDADARAIARRLFDALAFEHAGVSVRAAVGYARHPRDARGIDSLLMAADAALATAKDQPAERFSGLGDGI